MLWQKVASSLTKTWLVEYVKVMFCAFILTLCHSNFCVDSQVLRNQWQCNIYSNKIHQIYYFLSIVSLLCTFVISIWISTWIAKYTMKQCSLEYHQLLNINALLTLLYSNNSSWVTNTIQFLLIQLYNMGEFCLNRTSLYFMQPCDAFFVWCIWL